MQRRLYLALSTATGIFLAWIDTRPHWNDTGVTVGLVFCAAAFWSYVAKEKPWLYALAVGVWIPVFNIIMAHNAGSLLALAPAFAGAYIASFIRNKL